MRLLALALITNVFVVPAYAGPMKIGNRVRISQGFMACKELDDLNKVKTLAFVDNDALAAAKYANSKDCVSMETGTTGIIKDHSIMSNATCIRQQGEPDCYWIPSPLIAPGS